MTFLALFFVPAAAHAWADFSVQTDATAANKNRHNRTGAQRYVPWYYWMAAHALTHGLAVAVALGCFFQAYHPNAGRAAWGFAVWCGAVDSAPGRPRLYRIPGRTRRFPAADDWGRVVAPERLRAMLRAEWPGVDFRLTY